MTIHPLYDIAQFILGFACVTAIICGLAAMIAFICSFPRTFAATLGAAVIWAVVYLATHHP